MIIYIKERVLEVYLDVKTVSGKEGKLNKSYPISYI